MLPKEVYQSLDEQVVEWEKVAEEHGGSTKDMSLLYKDLLKVLKKSDKYGFIDISSMLLFIIHSINTGYDATRDLALEMFDYMNDMYDLRKENETGIINNDGSFLTFEQLEKEIKEKEMIDKK